MSFKATLDIEDKTFELIYCASQLEQKTDGLGRPASGVRGGSIWLAIKGTSDDTFSAWASDPAKQQDGSITFFRFDQDAKFKKIEFKNAYLTDLVESFIAEEEFSREESRSMDDAHARLIRQIQQRTKISYIILCNISAEKIKIDGVEHDNKW